LNEPGIKLTTYFSERDRSGDRFLADSLFDVYERHRIHTSILLRGVEGFGQHNKLQTDRLLTLSEDLPAVSIATDTRARIERALPDLLRIATHGLITLERAALAAGEGLGRLQPASDPARALKLTLYGGRSSRYVDAIDRLRRAGAAGASVLLGVDGTLHGARRRGRFFSRNTTVPLMLIAVGDATNLRSALPTLQDLLDDPVATIETVQVCKSNGQLFAPPHPVAETDSSGLPIWQKLMVHSEEQAKVNRTPLHRELVRQLREAGAAGATVLRGMRGFYGDHEPFADRMFQLRRNVPVHVILVDTPSAVKRWWPIVDELTREAGLVTSELVPASHAFASEQDRELRLASTPTSSGATS
jgi:PII-like signaling protein